MLDDLFHSFPTYVASPLHALTRKNVQFEWTTECQRSFDQLKQRLIEAPLLAYPDFSQSFMLETDAYM